MNARLLERLEKLEAARRRLERQPTTDLERASWIASMLNQACVRFGVHDGGHVRFEHLGQFAASVGDTSEHRLARILLGARDRRESIHDLI